MSNTQSLNFGDELDKVKNVLGALWAKVSYGTEEEANSVALAIDAIGSQPEPEPVEPVAEIATETVTPTKPLSEMTDDELKAELAKREIPTGSGS